MLFCALLCASVRWPAVENRKRNEICRAYRSNFVPKAKAPVWKAGSGGCSVGSHDEQDRFDALNKINFYRFMIGLTNHEVTLNQNYDHQCYQGSLVLSKYGGLSHHPPSSIECWSKEAYTACSTSNIAMGMSTASYSIDMYVDDDGVASLGHRRWILQPELAEVGIGLVSRYSVLKVIGTKRVKYPEIPFVAYPGPGWNVKQAVNGVWSFSINRPMGTYTATITNGSNTIPVQVQRLESGYGMNTFALNGIDNRYVKDGQMYDVKITNGSTVYEYQVRITNCSTLDFDLILEMSWFEGLAFGIGIAMCNVLFICGVVYLIFRKTIKFQFASDAPKEFEDKKPAVAKKSFFGGSEQKKPTTVGHSKAPLASDVPAAYAKR